MSSSDQTNLLIGGQLSEDTLLYVWTPTHVSRLNRRNKITSPVLQIPSHHIIQTQPNVQNISAPPLPTCKIVLLRGVVKAEDEQDDPIGVFLHFTYPPSSTPENSINNSITVRCKLSVTCTPVRPRGHSHTAGPEEFIFSSQENFKGMKSLLPAAALKPRQQSRTQTHEENNNNNNNNQRSESLSREEQDELHFQDTSPVEVHVKIQFLKSVAKKENSTEQQNESNASDSNTTTSNIMGQASSLFSSASSTLGSWWSAAATTGKEKVLPSVKSALSTAANKAEAFAHKIMKDNNNNNNNNLSGDNVNRDEVVSATNSNESTHLHSNKHLPWADIPQNFSSSPDAVRRWQELITKIIVQEQDCNFLWAPESAYGPIPTTSTKRSVHSTSSSPNSKDHPRFPFFTFSPEEELALSQTALSANQLLHCNDSYSFDADVDEGFINQKDPWTQHLRHMRFHLVPRLVSEERFWAAYLWRVKCLSFCKNAEQEAVVKTLISKPDVEPLWDPRDQQQQHQQQQQNQNQRNNNNNNTSSNNQNDDDDDDENNTKNLHHQSLLTDAEEAFTLLEEVVVERDEEGINKNEQSSSPSKALLTASIRGAERSMNHLLDNMKALDEVLISKPGAVPSLRESWKSQWRELSDAKNKLERMIERANSNVGLTTTTSPEKIEAVNNKNNHNNIESDDSEFLEKEMLAKKQLKEKQDQLARLDEAENHGLQNISSPPPEKPKVVEQENEKSNIVETEKSASAVPANGSPNNSSLSGSKSRAPVLMPWEEEDE